MEYVSKSKYWFYLNRNHFIFGSPDGDEQVNVVFRRIGKSTFVDFLDNRGFSVPITIISCVISFEPTIHAVNLHQSSRETPLLRANTIQTSKPTFGQRCSRS